MAIKRKISKRKTKTRRNCIPCNPSSKGMRRINPDEKNNLIGEIEYIIESISQKLLNIPRFLRDLSKNDLLELKIQLSDVEYKLYNSSII